MKKLLKQLLVGYLGGFLFLLSCFSVIGGIMLYVYKDKIVERRINTKLIRSSKRQIIHIKVKGELLERRYYEGLEFDDGNTYLEEIKMVLNHAATNDVVEGVLLELDDFFAGLADLDKLVYYIEQFRLSGKPLLCYTTLCKAKELYIAAHADYHMIYPRGEVELLGWSQMRFFYTGLMNKIGLRATVFRTNEGKSGPEDLFRKNMSPTAKRNAMTFLRSVDEKFLQAIATGRGLTIPYLRALRKGRILSMAPQKTLHDIIKPIGGLAWFTAQEAVMCGLADSTGSLTRAKLFFNDMKRVEIPTAPQENEEAQEEAKEADRDAADSTKAEKEEEENTADKDKVTTKSSVPSENKAPSIKQKKHREQPLLVSHVHYKRHYCSKARQPNPKRFRRRGGRVAGIYKIEGVIQRGLSRQGTIGDEDTIDQIEECGRNYDVLFLKIDSPGGDAVASDRIRLAIEEIRAQGTYVIAVMENICASGGLMIALAADEIWCYDGSIAGSVGVYAVQIDYEGVLRKIYINVDGVVTDISADAPIAGYRPPTTAEKAVQQKFLDMHYEHFLRISQRHGTLTHEEVMRFEGGKVFLGKAALNYRIADQVIVNLESAIAEKMQALYPEAPYIIYYHNEKTRLYAFFVSLRFFFIKTVLGPQLYAKYKRLNNILNMGQGVQAHYDGEQPYF